MPFAQIYLPRYRGLYLPQYDSLALSSVSRDPTSNRLVPATSIEWSTTLSVAGNPAPVPNHLWLMQELSGNPVDVIGTGLGARNLTATTAANAPAYSKVIPGWTRRAIGGAGAAVSSSLSNNTMVDTATTDFMVFMYMQTAPATGGLRNVVTYSTPAIQQPVSNKVRFRLAAALQDTVADHAGVVRPYLFTYSNVNATCRLYTDLERINLTYSTITGPQLVFQCSNTLDTTGADFLYACAWDGARVTDAQARALFQVLGYTVPW